jgi:hypothetical protein
MNLIQRSRWRALAPFVASAAVALGASVGLGTLVACSSSSSTVTASKDAGPDSRADGGLEGAAPEASTGPADVAVDAVIDPADCVAPGTSSGETGVGGYCSPGGGECAHAGPGGTATLCTADFGAPAHAWFCTVTCASTADCGAGGGACLAPPFAQQICVPSACASGLGDASSPDVDAGDAAVSADTGIGDATSDAAVDGASTTDAAPDGGVDAALDGALDASDASDASGLS